MPLRRRRRAATAASAAPWRPRARRRRSSDRGRCRSRRPAGPGRAPAPARALLDALAVARGREHLAAQHPPLRAGAVGAAEVEPGLGPLRLGPGPRLHGRDRRRSPCCSNAASREVLRGSSWICHHSATTSSSWQTAGCRAAGSRTAVPVSAAGLTEQGGHLLEAGVEDRVVDAAELRRAGQAARLCTAPAGLARQRDRRRATTPIVQAAAVVT